ncbi:hypothetical protein F0562_031912 [Nyssa sinensis]|uniref:TF-B3 domain-containing protein n=1 Tax=Nyssa sinensis TaxID=561372 RepID=A0A5J5ATI4_9ASTE|nr:hypothetical protein F0562_031912 [Nyssa sinensis]
MDSRMLSFQKKLSATDVIHTLEVPKTALHLPAWDESILVREQNGRVWQFMCPERFGDGRRYMTQQWREFVKTKSLMKGDIMRFYYLADEDVYYVEVERRSIRLFGFGMDSRMLSFQKKLSATDVIHTLEVPKTALHLPAWDESILVREQNGRVWQFMCPERSESLASEGSYLYCYSGFKEKVQGLEILKTIAASDQLKELPARGDVESGEIPSLTDLGLNNSAKLGQVRAIWFNY